jgi:hypothetical protein
MSDIGKTHRIIGIRHTLREIKDAGLIEEESLYPHDAVADLQEALAGKAKSWYVIGAKRGALAVLDAILKGDLVVLKNPETGARSIVANCGEIKWSKSLNVSTGNAKKVIKIREYKISVDDLGFEITK